MGFGKNLLRLAHSASKRSKRSRRGPNGEKVSLIKFPKYGYPFEELNYMYVYNNLLEAGFLNVELINLKDIRLGLFAKEGTIKKITVSGEPICRGGEKYSPYVSIVIYYHGRR